MDIWSPYSEIAENIVSAFAQIFKISCVGLEISSGVVCECLVMYIFENMSISLLRFYISSSEGWSRAIFAQHGFQSNSINRS